MLVCYTVKVHKLHTETIAKSLSRSLADRPFCSFTSPWVRCDSTVLNTLFMLENICLNSYKHTSIL